jgi:hypothetical protein
VGRHRLVGGAATFPTRVPEFQPLLDGVLRGAVGELSEVLGGHRSTVLVAFRGQGVVMAAEAMTCSLFFCPLSPSTRR